MVTLCPRRPVVEAHAVTQQQLAEAVTAAHQINTDSLARPDEIAQRLLLGAGYPDRVQLARPQQPHEQLGVATIGLHAIPGRPWDLARRRDDTPHVASMKLAREPVPGRTGLIRRARPRQPRAQPGRLVDVTAQREELQLPGLGIEHRPTILVACTSRPTRLLAFATAGSSAIVERRAAATAAATTSPHDHRGGTGPLLHQGPDERSIWSRNLRGVASMDG